MPTYDFNCKACETRFEALVPVGDRPPCPECGEPEAERVWGSFAYVRKGLRGADARKSDTARRDREIKRKESAAAKREQRSKG
jgi:putative FmdB family regulatory protein